MNSTTRTTRPLVAALGALALAASLAACGSAGSSGSGHDGHPIPMGTSTATGTAGTHNAADVSFATMMIPHHEQAVAMAELAPTRATTDGVRQLAAQVRAAQQPEIATMSGWLAAWGAPVPSGSASGMASGMAGHHMGDMSGHDTGSMPGMMSAQEMADLAAASGTAFDRMWLQLMVRHHEGAVAMARTEQAQGASAEAKALAGSIALSQTAEIERMQGLLAALPS